jgi:hypothetical protein
MLVVPLVAYSVVMKVATKGLHWVETKDWKLVVKLVVAKAELKVEY